MVMEDKGAIVQQRDRQTVISGEGGGGDTSISPNPETTAMNNNNNAGSVSPSISPTPTGGPVSSNSNVYLIGLEFVRQYYTVLHQGPLYLHRFYSEQSTFVHDDSKVVYGQQEIRDRIEQLNFRNCVAKILQVDSQETLGNGVVIQVRGELSNNGHPHRRFVQTFVLSPQTPKRYYVRNDIFHYQDDENCKDDLKARTRLDSHLSNEPNEDEKSEEEEELNDTGSHVPSVSAGSPTSASETPVVTPAGVLQQPEIPPPVEPVVDANVPEVSLLDTKVENKAEAQLTRPSHGFVATGAPSSGSDNGSVGGRGTEAVKEQEHGAAVTPSGACSVKTFANLFKNDLTPSASSGTHEFNRSPFPNKPSTGRLEPSPTGVDGTADSGISVSPAALSPQPPTPSETVAARNLPPRGGHNNFSRSDRGGYHGRERRERLSSRSSNITERNDDAGSVDGDNPRPRPIHTYPDSHQLFVGNLPHTVTIQEIKDIFEVFGHVAEVKILKPNQKNAGIKVPYFCFVVFEEQASAEAAIRDKSKISMKMSDGSNRRLNVEEKRPREMGFGGGPGNYFPREPKNENMTNSGGGGGPQQHQQAQAHGGGSNFRGGGNAPSRGMDVNNARGRDGGNVGGKDGNSGEYRSQNNNPRAHTRTFRGSNRGGGQGGERGGGSGAR